MSACPACRAELPDGARFCPACGTRLEAEGPEATERKVVTTLFADLVGFTALGERHDPEDIDAALRGFYALARTIVERFGGTVEKFIGDAVVGLFGVPITHEDDAERAVLAALELVAHMRELPPLVGNPLQVRCAVNTGPVLVRLQARPEAGEGVLVGDAVNTCARLLAEAPAMGVVAGERTMALSSRVIAYEPMAPRAAKGKERPVKRWLARGRTARRGLESRGRFATPMVGREVELASLDALLKRAIATSTPQFALISGEAGIGKSRLLTEFFRLIDERPDFFVNWRQGRCPPYGDELSYWVLREIVAAHAGILQTDKSAAVEEKLASVLQDYEDGDWIGERLRALVGLPARRSDRDEAFAAWLSFLQGLARRIPAVVVVEDIHWASEPTLDFLRHVVGHASAVPLLVIATARPEFLDAYAGLGDDANRVTHLALRALTPEDSARLARHLPLLSGTEDFVADVARRSGGNPLFAEELAWVLSEHGRQPGRKGEVPEDIAEPETMATLLSARLDALPQTHRAVLANASVMGNVFWPSAVASVGGLPVEEVADALAGIESRELARRRPESTYSGEDEYEFWHALMRDVAYQRMPRLERSAKHVAAADWMETTQHSGVADGLDLIAYHRTTALELARAAGREHVAERLRAPAVLALRRSAERLMSSDIRVAEREFERAVVLAAENDPQLPSLRQAWAKALLQAGRLRKSAEVFAAASALHRHAGDMTNAALAEAWIWYSLSLVGEEPSALPDMTELVSTAEPSPELADLLNMGADRALFACQSKLALDLADRAISVSSELYLPATKARELRSIALCQLGRADGIDEYMGVAQTMRAAGESHTTCTALSNLAEVLLPFEGIRRAGALQDQAIQMAARLKDRLATAFTRFLRFQVDYWAGRWDSAMAHAPEVERLLEEQDDMWDLRALRAFLGLLHLHREDADEARRLVLWADEHSRGTRIVGTLATTQIALAAVLARHDDADFARRVLGKFGDILDSTQGLEVDIVLLLPEALRTAVVLDELEYWGSLVEARLTARPFDTGTRAYLDGLRHEQRDDASRAATRFKEAAATWKRLGFRFEHAHAELGRARCLAAVGDAARGIAAGETAARTFRELGALTDLSAAETVVRSCT